MRKRIIVCAIATASVGFVGISRTAHAEHIERVEHVDDLETPFDVMTSYSLMTISRVKVGNETKTPKFFRHNIRTEFGWGPATFGVWYQRTDKSADTMPGEPTDGAMLTAGYDLVLNDWFRLDTFGRVGVTPNNNSGQPLYATDTDLRLKGVAFSTDGIAHVLGSGIFPSAYLGSIVNQFGRVQFVGGGGLWWHGISFYSTAFMSANGVDDPAAAGDQNDIKFANLNNAGLTLLLAYSLPVMDWGEVRVEAQRNIPFKNGGNDLTFSLQYRHFFEE